MPAAPVAASIAGAPVSHAQVSDAGWWSRLRASLSGRPPAARSIHVEVRRADTTIIVDWPLEGANECAAWLRDCLR
jgi:hypothetical protein